MARIPGKRGGSEIGRQRKKYKFDEKKYTAELTRLMSEHRMESELAAQRYIATVLDCDRNLEVLRAYNQDGTITGEERRAIVPLMKMRDTALEALGLKELKKKANRFRR